MPNLNTAVDRLIASGWKDDAIQKQITTVHEMTDSLINQGKSDREIESELTKLPMFANQVDPRAESIKRLDANTALSLQDKQIALGEIDRQYPPPAASQPSVRPDDAIGRRAQVNAQAAIEAGQQPDLMGRIKRGLLPERAPGENTMFGESDLPGRIVRGAGEFFIPGSNTEAGIAAGLGMLGGPIARGLKAVGTTAADIGARLVPQRLKSAVVEGVGTFLKPGQLREAGVEVAAGKMGQPLGSMTRAVEEKASARLFQQASKETGKIDPTSMLDDAIAELTQQSNPSRVAIKHIENMQKKFSTSGAGITYDRMIKELQTLRAKAQSAMGGSRPDINTGRVFYELRNNALAEMDKISPLIKQANSVYRAEESAKSIFEVLRRPNSGAKIRELFETDPMISKTFSYTGDELYAIADRIGSLPTNVSHRVSRALEGMSNAVIGDDAMRGAFRRVLDTTERDKLPSALYALGKAARSVVVGSIRGTPGEQTVLQTGRSAISRLGENQ